MSDVAPTLTLADKPDGPWWVLHGRWGAAQLGERAHWQVLKKQLHQAAGKTQGWDLRSLEWLDHVGAQLLWNSWGQKWPEQLLIETPQREMLERVQRLAIAAPPKPPAWTPMEGINNLGARVCGASSHIRHVVELIGQLIIDLGRVARAPRRAPWRDISGHLYRMGATALPITALVGFLIGVVLAYLMSLQLRQFGAESFIVNILGISLIRELGPMLAAILVAGRSGSSITAQIGVMRVTEELDAMRVLGIEHGMRLVLPRAVALAIAMPLISAWTTLAGLAGGMLAADLGLGISPAYFMQALPDAVSVGNLGLAIGKSVVFGLFIALIGCHWGLRVEPNTQSLGEGTTASVVTSITMVIIVDALFAIAFKSVGV